MASLPSAHTATDTYVPMPDDMRMAFLRRDIMPQLRERLQAIPAEARRHPATCIYLGTWLENRVLGERQGVYRKEMLIDLLAAEYETAEARVFLGHFIDYAAGQGLFVRTPIFRKIVKALTGFLRKQLHSF